ncbi:MAG: low molecular weight phosphotyrosine protein phosphatase [Bacilli bacterium]|nr:low molecular weight phosphotyrosine protein phosphatase [Bacilli bacterium]
MKTILFICHGNICRSAAAEYVFKEIVKKAGRENEFHIFSRGVSNEEYGNDIYPPMKRALAKAGIPFDTHFAMKMSKSDYESADAIFYMDKSNIRIASYLIPDTKKIYHPMSEFTPSVSDVEDPWYSGEFDHVLKQIIKCSEDILKHF